MAAYAPRVKWKGLDAVRDVPPVLTPAQIAELRCEPVVELVARDLERVAGAGTAPLHATTGATETPGATHPTSSLASRARMETALSTRRSCHTRETEPLQDLQTGFLRTTPRKALEDDV